MLNFFKKNKNIDTKKVTNFKIALKTIKQFIYVQDFLKAEKAINEIIKKENSYFDRYIETIDEKDKNKEIKKIRKNIKELENLKILNNKYKKEYEEKKYIILKKIEFKKTKENIKNLIWKKEYIEALNLVNILNEKYAKEADILKYSQNIKKQIQIKINELSKFERKNIKNDTLKEIKLLIWDIDINLEKKELEELNKNNKKNILKIFRKKILEIKNLKNKRNEKKLIDEVDNILKINDITKENLILSKLKNIHSWYKKEFKNIKIDWYDFYAKTISSDKISWDSIWFEDWKKNYWFYIADATWHWIKAWFIISKLTNIFKELFQKKSLEELTLNINNSLKQELNSWNFITSIFFDIKKENKEINIIGMGHLPIYIFRKTSMNKTH